MDAPGDPGPVEVVLGPVVGRERNRAVVGQGADDQDAIQPDGEVDWTGGAGGGSPWCGSEPDGRPVGGTPPRSPSPPPSPSRSIGLAGASTMSLVGTCGPWAWTPPSWPRQGAWRPGSGACARCPGSSQSPRTPRPGIRPLSPLDALAYFLVISALAPIDSSLPMPTTVRGFRRHFHMRHGTSFAGIHHESRRSLDMSRSRAYNYTGRSARHPVSSPCTMAAALRNIDPVVVGFCERKSIGRTVFYRGFLAVAKVSIIEVERSVVDRSS